MKNLKTILALLVAMAGCDKVDNAVQRQPGSNAVDTLQGPVATHKVLLEDYTGHHCGNCPAAAEIAESLQEQHGDDLVVIAVHAGFWTWVDKKYPTSYTTTAGNDWNSHFIGQNGNYPCGMVNRKKYSGTTPVSDEEFWPTLTSKAFEDEFIVNLELSQEYESASRLLDVKVKGDFKKYCDKNLMISVVITEDSIIGPQTDYRNQANSDIPDYVFMHMLRGAVNGSWGTVFTAEPKFAGDSVVVSFNDFPVNSKFNDKHLTVVAFAYEKDSREVIEVEKVKVGSKIPSL